MAVRVADRLQETPLSRPAFSELGGALQCALRAALLALRMCDKTVFLPSATAFERNTDEKQYGWMAYCATIATVYLIAIGNVETVLETGEIYSHASARSIPDLSNLYKNRWREARNVAFLNQRLGIYLATFWYPGQFEHLSHSLLCDLSVAINPALDAHATETPLSRVVRQAIERTVKDDITRRQNEVGTATATPGVTTPDVGLPESPAASSQPAVVLSPLPAVASTGGANRSDPSEAQAQDEDPNRVKAREWLKVLGCQVEHDQGVLVHGDGKVEISRKTLGFGASPSDNYQMLHKAGAVDKKLEKSVMLNIEWSKTYSGARAARKS